MRSLIQTRSADGGASESLRPWPVVPTIEPGDSLSGIIHRTARLNGTSRQAILGEVYDGDANRPTRRGTVDITGLPSDVFRRLAQKLDVPALALRQATIARLYPVLRNPGRAHHSPKPGHGRPISSNAIRWTYLRATPACIPCLQESGAHRVQWRIAIAPACVRHRLALLWHCPACGQYPSGTTEKHLKDVPTTHCQSCGASPDVLVQGQRQLADAEARALAAIEQRLFADDLDSSDYRWLRTLTHVFRLMRIADPVLEHLRDRLPTDVEQDFDRKRQYLQSRWVKIPPSSSLIAAMAPAVVAICNRRVDTLSAEMQVALHYSNFTDASRTWSMPADENKALVNALGTLPSQPRCADFTIDWETLLARGNPSSRTQLAYIPKLCPRQIYCERFEPLLIGAERHARKYGRAPGKRVTEFRGRQLVVLAAHMAAFGGSVSEANSRMDIHPSPTNSLLNQVAWGLDRLESFDQFRIALHDLLDWLASTRSPSFKARQNALSNHAEQLFEAVVRSGMTEANGRVWLAEHWGCTDRGIYRTPTEERLPAKFLDQVPAGLDQELDQLIAGLEGD